MRGRKKFNTWIYDLPSIAANTTADIVFTTADSDVFKGLRVGMQISVTPPSTLDAVLIVSAAWVATDDTLTVRIDNYTASAINAASGTFAYEGILE